MQKIVSGKDNVSKDSFADSRELYNQKGSKKRAHNELSQSSNDTSSLNRHKRQKYRDDSHTQNQSSDHSQSDNSYLDEQDVFGKSSESTNLSQTEGEIEPFEDTPQSEQDLSLSLRKNSNTDFQKDQQSGQRKSSLFGDTDLNSLLNGLLNHSQTENTKILLSKGTVSGLESILSTISQADILSLESLFGTQTPEDYLVGKLTSKSESKDSIVLNFDRNQTITFANGATAKLKEIVIRQFHGNATNTTQKVTSLIMDEFTLPCTLQFEQILLSMQGSVVVKLHAEKATFPRECKIATVNDLYSLFSNLFQWEASTGFGIRTITTPVHVAENLNLSSHGPRVWKCDSFEPIKTMSAPTPALSIDCNLPIISELNEKRTPQCSVGDPHSQETEERSILSNGNGDIAGPFPVPVEGYRDMSLQNSIDLNNDLIDSEEPNDPSTRNSYDGNNQPGNTEYTYSLFESDTPLPILAGPVQNNLDFLLQPNDSTQVDEHFSSIINDSRPSNIDIALNTRHVTNPAEQNCNQESLIPTRKDFTLVNSPDLLKTYVPSLKIKNIISRNRLFGKNLTTFLEEKGEKSQKKENETDYVFDSGTVYYLDTQARYSFDIDTANTLDPENKNRLKSCVSICFNKVTIKQQKKNKFCILDIAEIKFPCTTGELIFKKVKLIFECQSVYRFEAKMVLFPSDTKIQSKEQLLWFMAYFAKWGAHSYLQLSNINLPRVSIQKLTRNNASGHVVCTNLVEKQNKNTNSIPHPFQPNDNGDTDPTEPAIPSLQNPNTINLNCFSDHETQLDSELPSQHLYPNTPHLQRLSVRKSVHHKLQNIVPTRKDFTLVNSPDLLKTYVPSLKIKNIISRNRLFGKNLTTFLEEKGGKSQKKENETDYVFDSGTVYYLDTQARYSFDIDTANTLDPENKNRLKSCVSICFNKVTIKQQKKNKFCILDIAEIKFPCTTGELIFKKVKLIFECQSVYRFEAKEVLFPSDTKIQSKEQLLWFMAYFAKWGANSYLKLSNINLPGVSIQELTRNNISGHVVCTNLVEKQNKNTNSIPHSFQPNDNGDTDPTEPAIPSLQNPNTINLNCFSDHETQLDSELPSQHLYPNTPHLQRLSVRKSVHHKLQNIVPTFTKDDYISTQTLFNNRSPENYFRNFIKNTVTDGKCTTTYYKPGVNIPLANGAGSLPTFSYIEKIASENYPEGMNQRSILFDSLTLPCGVKIFVLKIQFYKHEIQSVEAEWVKFENDFISTKQHLYSFFNELFDWTADANLKVKIVTAQSFNVSNLEMDRIQSFWKGRCKVSAK